MFFRYFRFPWEWSPARLFGHSSEGQWRAPLTWRHKTQSHRYTSQQTIHLFVYPFIYKLAPRLSGACSRPPLSQDALGLPWDAWLNTRLLRFNLLYALLLACYFGTVQSPCLNGYKERQKQDMQGRCWWGLLALLKLFVWTPQRWLSKSEVLCARSSLWVGGREDDGTGRIDSEGQKNHSETWPDEFLRYWSERFAFTSQL